MLERFLFSNDLIDSSIQKGFLTGVNGTFEHIFSVCTILDNAMQCHLPLSMTFIDLKKAFGSVSHHYIDDILEHIFLPCEFRSYTTCLYSELTGFIATKEWKTNTFPIRRGVFQGDTLSPLIFLVASNPIIKVTQSRPSAAFHLHLPPSTTVRELPKDNSLCTRSGTSPSLKNLQGGT